MTVCSTTGTLSDMRYITEHLTSDAAQRYASLAGATTIVTREASGITYWYAVPNEMPRVLADAEIDERVRWHLVLGTLDVELCPRCALPVVTDRVGAYHPRCVPVTTPSDPTLFEGWQS